LLGNGITVALFDGDVPTPLVSWAVRERAAAGGIVITASHNPAEFNGFKIKAPWGGSATRETTASIEAMIDAQPPRRSDLAAGTRGSMDDSVRSYRAQIAAYVDLDKIRQAEARVVIDPMHGSGGRWVENFCAATESAPKPSAPSAIRSSAASIPNRLTAISLRSSNACGRRARSSAWRRTAMRIASARSMNSG
jgi:phosphomannomutase